MKKLIFTILLALFCFDFMQAKKVFVEMEYSNNTIKLDDGSNKKSQAIKDQNGNDIKFFSLIGALNYMSLQGSELLTTKTMTYELAGVIDSKVYYIFFKEASDEELKDIVSKSYKK